MSNHPRRLPRKKKRSSREQLTLETFTRASSMGAEQSTFLRFGRHSAFDFSNCSLACEGMTNVASKYMLGNSSMAFGTGMGLLFLSVIPSFMASSRYELVKLSIFWIR